MSPTYSISISHHLCFCVVFHAQPLSVTETPKIDYRFQMVNIIVRLKGPSNSSQLMTCYIIIPNSSALNEKNKEKVAIKKLHRPFQSEIFAKRAYRELRLLKHMKHENVSRLYTMHTQSLLGSCVFCIVTAL